MTVSSSQRLTSALIHLLHTEGRPGQLPPMSKIAAEAGLTETEARSIYPTEHDVLLAVGTIGWMKLFDMATRGAVAQDTNDPVAQLTAIGEAYLDWAFDDPVVFVLIHDRTRFSYTNDDVLHRHVNAMRQLVEGLFARATQMGMLRPDEDPQMQLLTSRSYLYGLARMYSDSHFPEWVPGCDPRTLASEAFQDFMERMMGSRSELAVRRELGQRAEPYGPGTQSA